MQIQKRCLKDQKPVLEVSWRGPIRSVWKQCPTEEGALLFRNRRDFFLGEYGMPMAEQHLPPLEAIYLSIYFTALYLHIFPVTFY